MPSLANPSSAAADPTPGPADSGPRPSGPEPALRLGDLDARLHSIGYASFMLIGWAGLLVPSLIRSIEHDFGQSDAGLGLFYFVYALFYASGGALGGLLTERIGRRRTLPLAAASVGLGLAALALAPAWAVFLVAAVPVGLGGGAIDGGVNGLFLELHPGRGNALNLLHLFFSIGALVAPLVVGLIVGAGIAWSWILVGTSLAALAVARQLTTVEMPSGRHVRAASAVGSRTTGPRATGGFLTVPLLMLAVAIGCYVATEIGTSSWIVRFLGQAPLTVATGGLSAFWAGLAMGRFIASRIADRFPPIAFSAGCALLAGLATIGAVLAPGVPASIALFALAGLAQGPIYPMIMAIAGSLRPGRSGAVSGLLTAAAVVGGLVYPPIIGFVSVTAGIGVGIAGAGGLALVAALSLYGAGRLQPRAHRADDRPPLPAGQRPAATEGEETT